MFTRPIQQTCNSFLYSRFFNLYFRKFDNKRRNTSSLDISGKEPGNKGQSRSWIVGNKIIQIRTGLFSNICFEDPTLKPRLNSNGHSTKSSQSSKAINIPYPTANENLASSGGSSVGNNNSFSSNSLSSNNTQLNSSENSTKTYNAVKEEKNYEQDLFDETLDAGEARHCTQEETPKAPPPSYNSCSTGSRRNNMKRRYKSGLPTTADRHDDDSTEESYSKLLFDPNNCKLSKDDSGQFLTLNK